MRVELTNYVQDVEDWFVNEIKVSVGDTNLHAIVRLFNADANDEATLNELIGEAERLPVILVGVRDKVDDESPSTDPRHKHEVLEIDVLICTRGLFDQTATVRVAWPLIEVVEEVMTGRLDVPFTSDRVRVRDAVRGKSVVRALELPGFIIQQAGFSLEVTRVLA